MRRTCMNQGLTLLTIVVAASFACVPARADYVVYTNQSSFAAAITSGTTENFDELSRSAIFYPSGLDQFNGLTQPLTITGTSGSLISTSASESGGFYPSNGTYLIGPISTTSTDGITVALPASTYNAAGSFVTLFGATGIVSFFGTTSHGENFSGSVTVDGTIGSGGSGILGFLGVTTNSSTDYLTSLTFSAPVGASQNVVIDNFTFGTAAVPEPASMALFSAGALALGIRAWKRRARA